MTFWLRPAFALRVVSRFQRLVGFDRSMALASSALTAGIPLALLVASVVVQLGQEDLATRLINRYGLTGGGAEAVRSLFSFAEGPGVSLGVGGTVFLIISSLSLARAAQRLFEQTWELPPLSVRNTLNGLRWLAGLVAYAAVGGWLYATLGEARFGLLAAACEVPLTAVFLVWGGWTLCARRQAWRDLVPFGVVGAVASSAYSVVAAVYLPHLFSSYATRFGPVGAVFAMIAALFGVMVVLVASSALGREVHDELGRIARGNRPPDDEVRQEWAAVVAQAQERWVTAREELARRRSRRNGRGR
ncbi:hypothetical protein [Streptacidiphilus sp. MAP5-3]|uniref:hypothetical protein n=1 Tax=unclassified Streptacidiphilus TaxID=2643834 RepID=UPI00351875FD